MLHSLRSAARRRGALLAAGTAVVLAVGGGTTAAFAATGAETATAAKSCDAPHLRALLHTGTPKALRADLKALHAKPKDERAAARKAIRAKAAAGAYGAKVERTAHLFHHAKGHAWLASLPAALQTDLKALRALEPKSAERTAKAEAIAQKALAGGYGTTIQTHAKQVQARIDARCAAKG